MSRQQKQAALLRAITRLKLGLGNATFQAEDETPTLQTPGVNELKQGFICLSIPKAFIDSSGLQLNKSPSGTRDSYT